MFRLLAGLVLPLSLHAQHSSVVRGTVRAPSGHPVGNATVFLLETLEEVRTDSAGRFSLASTTRGTVTLVARRVGYMPGTIDVVLPVDTLLTVVLREQSPLLGTIVVVAAGEYTLGTGSTATLGPREVAQTPGAAANIARAIQTLPGVQGVDEGTGLFVRGGDVSETRVMIDDATFLTPVRFDNPTGHITNTVDPFVLDRTVFSAGGFGAQYGNALSGIVRMESAGRPVRTTGSLSASIGSVGGAVAWAPHARIGVRSAATISSLAPLTQTFGAAQPYEPAPRGSNVSASAEWKTGDAGRLRAFGVTQRGEFGVGDATASGSTSYHARNGETFGVLSWRDSSTRVQPALTFGHSRARRDETIGELLLDTQLSSTQMIGALGWRVRDGLQLRGGVEFERLSTRYAGTIRLGSSSRALFDARPRVDRTGAWGEAQWHHARGVRLNLGVRTDDASLLPGRLVDPRASVAWQVRSLALTAAWGRYSQIAEPTFFRPSETSGSFAPMSVQQRSVGAQWGNDSAGLRIELYDKQYRGLWQFSRDNEPVGGGRGTARGSDLLMRWKPFPSSTWRLSWSTVASRRTDPNTGRMARAIGDVTHSAVVVTETRIRAFTFGLARRWATGRPFTDVVGVRAAEDALLPVWGEPNAARLPHYARLDASASWFRTISDRSALVLWGSVSNIANRVNVMRYRWTEDYSQRLPVQAPFNRSVYVGATVLF